MKKTCFTLIVVLAFFSCNRDPQWESSEWSYEEQIEVLTPTSVLLTLRFDDNIKPLITGVNVRYRNNTFSSQIVEMQKNNEFTAFIGNLEREKEYHIEYLIEPEYLRQRKYESSFVAHCDALPIAKTGKADELTPVSAMIYGKVETGVSEYKIDGYGFYYSLLQTGEYERHQVRCGGNSTGADFKAQLSLLRAGATYYYYAYATNANGTAYGDTLSFTLPTNY